MPRPNANTNGIRTPNHSLPLADRVKIICYKCGKTGHFSNQYHVRQGFQPGLNVKRPPQPVRMVQQENTDALQMTPEEVHEKIEYEESAEYPVHTSKNKNRRIQTTGRLRSSNKFN